MDARDRFSDTADAYAKYRPDYPDSVVHQCEAYAALSKSARIVDIGCGTGISSRLFARHGYAVFGIDPNAAMLDKARAAGQAQFAQGEAAATGLPSASADLIICAQALHWFDLDACLSEWRRVLDEAGACAAFWNLRRRDGWQADYEALLSEWSSEYAVVKKAADGEEEHSAWVKQSPQCIDLAEHSCGHEQSLDWPGLLGRANSSSYVIHGVRDRPGFERALRELFDRHERGGRVTFRYRTYVLMWRFAASS